ncbi:MAG: DUF2007 domain-containing protein [Flavobacteriales bacterium]|nr:DUF2007 domain-containing protein [Flavobacteriales bacterium]
MEKDWVAVYSTDNSQSITIIKAMLETNDIHAIEIDKQASPYNIGEVELCVKREHVLRAKYLIDKKST